MIKRRSRILIPLFALAGLVAGLTTTFATATSAGADPVPAGAIFVSATPPQPPWRNHHHHGRTYFGCDNAQYSTISAAVAAAPSGSTVVVCPGTYSEDVVVSEPLTILGTNATVNPGTATNSPAYTELGNNAFTVLAPNVTIKGFTVEDANGDGILSIANYTTIEDNTALDNGSGPNGGTGIDLNGSSYSTVKGNTAEGNVGGGVYLTNDTGEPASYDTVVNNVFDGNTGGCGIILADHTGFGVFDNKIIGNEANDNGNDPAGSGAGVVLASPVPGGAVYNNLVADNSMSGNGLAGITLHSHLSGQGNFSGNVLVNNKIGTNNTGGAASVAAGDDGDADTSGIYIGSVDPLTITIKGNFIHDDQYGIFDAGAITVNPPFFNHFFRVTTPLYSTTSYAG